MDAQSHRFVFCRRFSLALPDLFAATSIFTAILSLGLPTARAQAKPAAVQEQALVKPAAAARTTGNTAPEQAQAASTAARPGGRGMNEGIKVHGWWRIDVRNPDGTLAQHHEFENTLQPGGTIALSWLLSGFAVPGGWGINLHDSSAPALTGSSGSPCVGGNCFLWEPQYSSLYCPGGYSTGCSTNLTSSLISYSPPGSGNTYDELTLSGTIQASQTGNINFVGTSLIVCQPNVPVPTSPIPVSTSSPAQCAGQAASVFGFTQATLPSSNSATSPCGGAGQISCEISNVQPGQIINVSVTISFQ